MKKTFLKLSFILFLFGGFIYDSKGQGIPEILYYKFNGKSKTIRNLASSPPSGTKTASIKGALTIGSTGLCGSTVLIGSGGTSNTDYVETNWATTTKGSWTVSFWTNNMDTTTALFYIFSDLNAGAFRCFTGGVAGAGNILLRGPFNDVLLTGGASSKDALSTFVYDSIAGNIYAYLNGKLINTVAQGTIALSTSGTFILSGYNSLAGLNSGGMLDEFRFYSRALSATEVAKFTYDRNSSGTRTDTAVCSFTSSSGQHIWKKSGTYYDTISNVYNCDSVLTIYLTVTGNTDTTIFATACDYYLSPTKQAFWTSSGIYTETIKNKAGCDSNISVNLTIQRSTASNIVVNTCKAYTSPSGKYIWTQSGDYVDSLKNSLGCDSFINIKLTVHSTGTSNLNAKACNFYKSPSGKYIWTQSGVYKDTTPTKYGCDSVISVNLSLNFNKSSKLSPSVCESYLSPSRKYLWTKTGIYLDTIPAKLGCDSVITIDLNVKNNSSANLTFESCEQFRSPSGKYLWTFTGSYQDTIPNKAGCDSFLFINLKLYGKTASTQFKNTCVRYLSPSKKHVWKVSGKYFDTIPNRHGCDSIMTINLTIIQVNTAVTQNDPVLKANAFSAQYQWLDCDKNYAKILGETKNTFIAKSIGNYAVEIKENNCTDTSICYNVSKLSIGSIGLNNEIVMYPNPFNDKIHILSARALNHAKVRVMNLAGETIHIKNELFGTENDLDLSNVSAGVYFIEISEGNKFGRFKVIK